MKKYIVGFLVGAFFTISATAFADDIQNLIGKKVEAQYTVEVNGKTLNTVVVEGSNYAPVKAFSEAAGFEVTTEGKNVKVSEVKQVVDIDSLLNSAPTKENLESALQMAKNKVDRYTKAVETYKLNVEKYSDTEAKKNSNQIFLDTYKSDLAAAQAKVIELQARLAEL